MIHLRIFKHLSGAVAIAAGVLTSFAAQAETSVVVGYQQIVGPFISAIADGRFDAAAKEAGYTIDWRQFSSGGDISTALASGNVPIGVIGSTERQPQRPAASSSNSSGSSTISASRKRSSHEKDPASKSRKT